MSRPDGRALAAIFAGGAGGALLRVVFVLHSRPDAASWPWATFAINLAGAFALGYFATRLQDRLPLSTYRRPFVGTGFCGALTTFSTVQIELLMMLDAHRYALAAGYASASVAGGYVCVHLATAAVRRVRTIA
ncbi:MAG: fluoride exporter [bacterium]|jgi:CrcB protein